MAFTLWLVTLIVFCVTHLLPGNVAVMILGQYQNVEQLRALEAKLGLNDPLPLQYWRWLRGILPGGPRGFVRLGRPVAPLLLGRIQPPAPAPLPRLPVPPLPAVV